MFEFGASCASVRQKTTLNTSKHWAILFGNADVHYTAVVHKINGLWTDVFLAEQNRADIG